MKTHYSRIALGTLISAISLSIASPAFAQFAKPEDAVKYRQSTFALMGAHMGRLAAVVKGETPYNKDNVVRNAAIISMLSGMPWQAFGAGTEGGKAQPNIWTDGAKFKSASEKMHATMTSAKSNILASRTLLTIST